MQGIALEERKRLGALLDSRPQAEVMAMIPQFSCAETDNFVAPPAQPADALGVLMFNMERGVHLEEIREFLASDPKFGGGATILSCGDLAVRIFGLRAQRLQQMAEKIKSAYDKFL